jgi:O-acetyl-ADP-ribose deacetylase
MAGGLPGPDAADAHLTMERLVSFPNRKRIRLLEGDITRIPAGAIVNAANAALAGGGGVDGAIHRAGGPEIMRELNEIRPRVGHLAAGQAVATTAGNLPAQYVFHTVGPIYSDGRQGEPTKLASCYRICMAMADERKLGTLSFPAISTGIYGYPKPEAAAIAVNTVRDYLTTSAASLEEVILVQFSSIDYRLYDDLLSADERR